MPTYYYDDDCAANHFKSQEFANDDFAIIWFERLKRIYKPKNCVLYTEENSFRVVKEFNLVKEKCVWSDCQIETDKMCKECGRPVCMNHSTWSDEYVICLQCSYEQYKNR